MTYSNPLVTISSIGVPSTPILVFIESLTEPTTRANGGDLVAGDNWWDLSNSIEYTWIVDNGVGSWVQTGGASIAPATTTTLGGVIVGTGLLVQPDGTLSVDPDVNIEQTFLNFDGPDTTQAIRATGAPDKKFSIRVGETAATSSIVATFQEGKLTLPNGELSCNTLYATTGTFNGTFNFATCDINTITGVRSGVIWKLSAGDGMQFDNQPSGHIGGTPGATAPGDAYNVGYGTISVGPTVLRATDTQTIVGDLVVQAAGTGVNPTRLGTVTAVKFIGDGSELTNVTSTPADVPTITPGSYTAADITVNSKGQLTAAASATSIDVSGSIAGNSFKINNQTEIKSYGTIIAWRNSAGPTDPIQKWNSAFRGNNTTIADITANGDFKTYGNITVQGTGKFVGDGSLLTNLPASSSEASNFTWDASIIPDSNAAYDLGNAEYKVRHLFLSDNSIYSESGKLRVGQWASGQAQGASSWMISLTELKTALNNAGDFESFKAEILALPD